MLLSIRRSLLTQCLLIRSMATSSDKVANRLAQERSPYLLQHAYNPVQWYPWGQEAFDKAKIEKKMIFLSIGYSTCHWCHVMERESFENPDIGEVMNENFISIKVDREERPDVDRVYMTFVQATTGSGGWPLSIWLTPDLKPVVGGTYFAPDGRYYGRPGFKTVLLNIATKWSENQDKVEEQGTIILNALMKFSTTSSESSSALPNKAEVLKQSFTMMKKSYDEHMGGFGEAPKFPQSVNLNFLVRYHQCQLDASREEALTMVKHTLDKMASGGIHDHIAKGFHRYSTDARWHVPHFEKMLYDQGQLAVAYAEAHQITKEPMYAQVARDILEYVSRDLSHEAGGFYSAEDADSYPNEGSKEKKEGAFCVWTYNEVHSLLKEPIGGTDKTLADLFSRHYGLKKNGNVDPLQDPHDELKNQNVLIVEKGIDDTADYFGMEVVEAESYLAKAREILYQARLKRPRASLDDKILTAWNGLMISGYAKCGQVLGEEKYIDRALKAATFIKDNMYDKSTQTLLRSAYTAPEGQITQIDKPIDGFADDYASLVRGLIDVYEACYDASWLEWAEKLQDKQNTLFWDEENAGYFNTSDKDSSIVLRLKEDQDGAEPGANSVSCANLLRLADYLDSDAYREKALAILRHFSHRLVKIPIAVPELVGAFIYHAQTPKQIIIVGERTDPATMKLLDCIHAQFLPNKVVILSDPTCKGYLHEKLSILKSFEMVDGKPTAYVCENYTCQLPVNEVQDLQKLLRE